MKQRSQPLKLAAVSLLAALCSLPAIAEVPPGSSFPRSSLMQVLPGVARPGFDPLQLLQAKQVQQELQLTEAQVQKLKTINDTARSQVMEYSRGNKAIQEIEKQVQKTRQQVAEVLQPNQLNRFREILLQVNGWTPESPMRRATGLNQQSAINLSPAQQQQLADLQGKTHERMSSLFNHSASSDPAAICQTINNNWEQIESIRQASKQQALEVLTPEQRVTLKKLEGKPFVLAAPNCQS